ncbi:MAG: hypothetical protein M1819_000483 [Sarea resinae]|nr:MAG: hypothetical protein M1819_000483 [Sarea resinae]
MASNGGPVGGNGDGSNGNGGQPQGTEYTLQGVMRFLQTEWHRHERDRNAWEIERAEMKARIAKMEGDNRSTKKMQDSLRKYVHILEVALKKEREKAKTPPSQQATEGEAAAKEGKKEREPAPKAHNSFLDTDSEPQFLAEFRQDSQRDKSRVFLDKCVQEITYLLNPVSHPQHPPMNPHEMSGSAAFGGPQGPQQNLEEIYLSRQRGQPGVGMAQSSSNQRQQMGPISDLQEAASASNQPEASSYLSRNLSDQQPLPQGRPLDALDNLPQPQSQQTLNFPSATEEQVEKVTHSYDEYGRPLPARQEDIETGIPGLVEGMGNPDNEGWNFDEPAVLQEQEPNAVSRPDTDAFPSANHITPKSPPRAGPGSHHRRKSSSSSTAARRRMSDGSHELRELSSAQNMKSDSANFKVRFALRGHLDVVRSVIFTGGGSPSEPEICTAGDDGVIKRWIIPATYGSFGSHSGSMSNDLDVQSYFTHRGHEGVVTSLAACPASQNFSNGGRALGDGWIFSGGQDATVRVWERGRVDPKATLDGHTDAVWTVCVLPASCGSVFGQDSGNHGGPDRILLASGSADGTVKIWAVSAPPQLSSPQTGSRRGVGGSRRHSVSSGSNFPSSPQPSTPTATPFHYTLVHTIQRPNTTSPTCISPLSLTGDSFVVSYTDASVLIFDTRTAEEIIGMASLETYDDTPGTGVNSVVATTVGLDGSLSMDSGRGVSEDESMLHGATGSSGEVDGVVISGHEDRYIRFFDANSGQCTYNMLAHPSAISSLSLSPDGRELVSAGHDASLRFWSLEKRSCIQEITSHRLMRGEGVCAVVWSQDGRWVVSGGGDGVVKVFAR